MAELEFEMTDEELARYTQAASLAGLTLEDYILRIVVEYLDRWDNESPSYLDEDDEDEVPESL